MKVLLHADGGIGIGLGHASRCSALAASLRRKGHSANVLVDPSSGLSDYLSRLRVPAIEAAGNSGNIDTHAEKLGADVIVIDSYAWSAADFTAIRRDGRSVVAFDDQGRQSLPVDAIINGAPAAARLAYRALPHTRLWLGLAYQVTGEAFRDVPARGHAGKVNRVLVLVGGDDPLRLLPQLAQRLDAIAAKADPVFQVQLVCGPYATLPAEEGLSHVEAVRHPPDLKERMLNADLAVSASGQTLYELARCGTPAIAFCTGEDQVQNLAALADAGVVWDVGPAGGNDWLDAIEEAILVLAATPDRRDLMSAKALRLVDGRGADRLVEKLQQLVACTARQFPAH